MKEALLLLALGGGWLLLLGALGAGPAAILGAGWSSWILLAPILGLAVGPSLLATAALVLPMSTAALVVLLPTAVISVAFAVFCIRGTKLIHAGREVAVPSLLGIAGILLAAAPGLAVGSTGPFAYAVADVWVHVPKSLWLADHTVLERPMFADFAHRLPEYVGWTMTDPHQRIGLAALNAAFARIAGVGAEETFFPLSAAIFGLLPVAIWISARRLGVSRLAGGIGAAFGLTAGGLTMVVDGATENLGGMVLAVPLVIASVETLHNGGRSMLMAGVLLAGLFSIYPEYLPPTAIAFVLVAALVGRAEARRHGAAALGAMGLRIGGVIGVAATLAPYALVRDAAYLWWLTSYSTVGGAVRHLTPENVGAWAFGVLHLYQLGNFPLLSAPKVAIAVFLPLALAAIVALGVISDRRALVVVVPPIAVSSILAVYLYSYRTDHEYALWKWLTLPLPFLFVGVAIGVHAALHRPIPPFVPRRALAAAALGTAAMGLLAAAYADVKFTRLLVSHAAYVSADAREVVEEAQIPRGADVFLEGYEATPYPLVDYIGLYLTALRLPGARVSYDVQGKGPGQQGDQLLRAQPPFEQLERSDYDLVFTTFAGLRSARTTAAQEGRFAVQRRAPLDVLTVGIGAWVGEGENTVPYAIEPFQFWVSANRSQRASLIVRTDSSEGPVPLSLTLRGRPLRLRRDADGTRVCASVPVERGFTVVDATPAPGPPREAEVWTTDSARISGQWPPPALSGLAIRAVRARAGDCTY